MITQREKVTLMDKETADALEASIAKWERNASVHDLEDARIAPDDCPLCVLFNTVPNLCDDCPVKDRTGSRLCYGSPYSGAWEAMEAHDLPAFRAAARREVAFLKSLRDKPEPSDG